MGLKPLTINTPAESAAHILAEDDAALYARDAGTGQCIELGEQIKSNGNKQ